MTSIVHLTDRKTPQMIPAVYFLQPTQLTLQRLANDFATSAPYSKVYVFFSSKVSRKGPSDCQLASNTCAADACTTWLPCDHLTVLCTWQQQ